MILKEDSNKNTETGAENREGMASGDPRHEGYDAAETNIPAAGADPDFDLKVDDANLDYDLNPGEDEDFDYYKDSKEPSQQRNLKDPNVDTARKDASSAILEAAPNAAPEDISEDPPEDEDYAVILKDATVRFNLSTERVTTLKEYVVRIIQKRMKYNEFFPVKDISLKIKQGEAWGFIGVNGSGKSTLLKLICQILKPYRGHVEVNGTIAPLIELGAGMDPELSGRKNIFLNGAVLGHSIKEMKQYFDEIVEFSELGNFLDVPLKNYSSGMRARLGFSVATMVRPKILVVDEVLAVGDFAFQQKCQLRMKKLREGGTTLLFVSHSDRTVRDICDHAMWLDRGRCMMQGDVDAVCDAYLDSFKRPMPQMVVSKPAKQPSGQAAKQMSGQPAAQPADKPSGKPVVQSADKPSSQPTDESASQSDTQRKP